MAYSLLAAAFVAVVVVNAATLIVRMRLNDLVRSAGRFMGDRTAATYTRLLFNELMAGPFFSAPPMETLGDRRGDSIIRSVKGTGDYKSLVSTCSYLRLAPLNFVPFLA